MTTAISPPNTQIFWDQIAQNYACKPIADRDAYEQKLERLGMLLGPSDQILEIGCGTGSTALRIAGCVANVTATDVSRGMIDIARARLGPEAPANVTFLQADAQEVIDDHPFDAVCAFSLLHLVDDLPSVLAQVHRQLKPGGLFISKTVCVKEANILVRALIPALHALGMAPNVVSFSAEELAWQIETAGFQLEEASYFGATRRNPFIVARRTAC